MDDAGQDLTDRLTSAERERRWPNLRPRDAATLIIIDRRRRSNKILMGRRHDGHKFMPGKFVFPGGRIEREDWSMPACGEGRVFGRWLKVADSCTACSTELHHQRADDLPPYIVIAIVGHIVGYGILTTEMRFDVPLWFQAVFWPVLTIALSVLLLQPVKGAVVGLQYALGMHGFDGAKARREEEIGRRGPGPDRSPHLGGT